ncbi:putative WD repeat-containing protein [Porphyridium purpureum]|uniref:Putative WD repeat-containing protein n=1 Tax=Porphyridium purpureum TaxID=35688 RepID=A0A5J4YN62_PORPP|nr:putative WD repeat-containing protein [Porphyridium purpureum]|eukprot:POR2855..scf222_8
MANAAGHQGGSCVNAVCLDEASGVCVTGNAAGVVRIHDVSDIVAVLNSGANEQRWLDAARQKHVAVKVLECGDAHARASRGSEGNGSGRNERAQEDASAVLAMHPAGKQAAPIASIKYVKDKALYVGSADGQIAGWTLEQLGGTSLQQVRQRVCEDQSGHVMPPPKIQLAHPELAQIAVVENVLASCGKDAAVRLWDVETGAQLAMLAGHKNWVRAVALGALVDTEPTSPAHLVVSGGRDKTVRLWDVRATGRQSRHSEIAVLSGHTSWVHGVALSSTGTVLSAGGDKSVIVWDLAMMKPRYKLEGHTLRTWAVAVDERGAKAVSGSSDATVRVWSLDEHENAPAVPSCAAVLSGHTDGVLSVDMARSGMYCVSGCEDGSVRVWNLARVEKHGLETKAESQQAEIDVENGPLGDSAPSDATDAVTKELELLKETVETERRRFRGELAAANQRIKLLELDRKQMDEDMRVLVEKHEAACTERDKLRRQLHESELRRLMVESSVLEPVSGSEQGLAKERKAVHANATRASPHPTWTVDARAEAATGTRSPKSEEDLSEWQFGEAQGNGSLPFYGAMQQPHQQEQLHGYQPPSMAEPEGADVSGGLDVLSYNARIDVGEADHNYGARPAIDPAVFGLATYPEPNAPGASARVSIFERDEEEEEEEEESRSGAASAGLPFSTSDAAAQRSEMRGMGSRPAAAPTESAVRATSPTRRAADPTSSAFSPVAHPPTSPANSATSNSNSNSSSSRTHPPPHAAQPSGRLQLLSDRLQRLSQRADQLGKPS